MKVFVCLVENGEVPTNLVEFKLSTQSILHTSGDLKSQHSTS